MSDHDISHNVNLEFHFLIIYSGVICLGEFHFLIIYSGVPWISFFNNLFKVRKAAISRPISLTYTVSIEIPFILRERK